MPRLLKWLAPALTLAILAIFSNTWVAADDAPTSQPMQLGSITVKVVDQSSQIVVGARVQLAKPSTMPSTDPTADDTGGGGRRGGRRGGGGRGRGATGPVLASGMSDTDGTYTFKDILLGNYIVTASTTGQTRTRGREAVKLGPDGTTTITVTLMPRASRGGAGAGGGAGGGGNNNGGAGGGGGGNGG